MMTKACVRSRGSFFFKGVIKIYLLFEDNYYTDTDVGHSIYKKRLKGIFKEKEKAKKLKYDLENREKYSYKSMSFYSIKEVAADIEVDISLYPEE